MAASSLAVAVIALVGGTVIDVSHSGAPSHDLASATVILQGGKIVAVGPAGTIPIPPGAKTVDVTGKFLIPGLVDGFTGMRNQEEADAELYEGVTTIVASGDDRRGTLYLAANPSPHVYPIDTVGTMDDWSLLRGDPAWRDRLAEGTRPHELAAAETAAQMDETARRGTRAILLWHNLTSANTASIIAQARRLHLATYGEFIATPYQDAIADGVQSLLHMSRLELGLAPRELAAATAQDPFGPASDAAYRASMAPDPASPAVASYGDLIAAHHVALMPTFSLFYAELPGHRDLSHEPAMALFDGTPPGQPARPPGAQPQSPQRTAARMAFAATPWALDRALIARHPLVLAASGADYPGQVPGLSMHTELELLVQAGLTPREALAAATANYATQFGWQELGAIEPNRRADLVILDQDPTRDIANLGTIEAVYLAGQSLDRASLLKH